MVLYDRETDPDELHNLAGDPAYRDLLARMNTRLEALIEAEIGDDTESWVAQRPRLLGWPVWHGDEAV